jgi:hypothetical protein
METKLKRQPAKVVPSYRQKIVRIIRDYSKGQVTATDSDSSAIIQTKNSKRLLKEPGERDVWRQN